MPINFGKGNNKPPLDEDDAFGMDDHYDMSEEEEDFFSSDDDLDSIFNKLKNSLPGSDAQRLIDALKSDEVYEKLKEAAFNSACYVINFLYDGYALMRLTRELHKHYPQIPALSFGQSVAVSRVLASIMRSAIYLMQLQPAKTYKEVLGG